jgi:putative flippase GtrA
MFKLFIEAAKYAAASAVALSVDVGLLLALTHYAGWHYQLAATFSFIAGASVAYVLSVRFVFTEHRLHSRKLEFTWFVLLGLAGLGINALMLYVTVSRLGMDLLYAKAVAACCTFVANFGLRRQLLFHTRAGAALA